MRCKDFNVERLVDDMMIEACWSDPDYEELRLLESAVVDVERDVRISGTEAEKIQEGIRMLESFCHASHCCKGNFRYQAFLFEHLTEEDITIAQEGAMILDDYLIPKEVV